MPVSCLCAIPERLVRQVPGIFAVRLLLLQRTGLMTHRYTDPTSRRSQAAELHPLVAERPRDHFIQKAMASAFVGTDLGE